jgi:hypothetical protein
MLSMQEVNIIGQILNDTYGASSTIKSPTYSIKTTMQGNMIVFNYTTVANLVMGLDIRSQLREQERASVKLIDEKVKDLKSEFKKAAGRALKIKEDSTNDSVEFISMSPHNPKRTVYYKRKTIFVLED